MKDYPLTKIKQHFPDNSLKEVVKVCQQELGKLSGIIPENDSVGIGVGSRGIDNMQTIVREAIDFIKGRGAHPFIIPAMGSHGGATSEGQREILASYGITEDTMGVPIKSSMEVVELSGGETPNPVYMGKQAFESDGLILINKIKPHTDFHATYESGLVKMAVIGLGKEHGAAAIHHYGVYGLTELLPRTADVILATGKILGGLALIENANDRTMMIRAIKGEDIKKQEPALLEIARSNRPEFPVDKIDILLIDQMGKNISGTGIDTNTIGRIKIYGQKEPEHPKIRSIVVGDLTEESHGNAIGVGLADVITRKLYDKINFETTYKNVSTSSFLERGKIPCIAANDYEAMQLALRNCGVLDPGNERIIRIKDTAHLNELYVSDAVLEEIKDKSGIELINGKTKSYNSEKSLILF
jgi:hypothetical protein